MLQLTGWFIAFKNLVNRCQRVAWDERFCKESCTTVFDKKKIYIINFTRNTKNDSFHLLTFFFNKVCKQITPFYQLSLTQHLLIPTFYQSITNLISLVKLSNLSCKHYVSNIVSSLGSKP
jgi:polyphosphate kinase